MLHCLFTLPIVSYGSVAKDGRPPCAWIADKNVVPSRIKNDETQQPPCEPRRKLASSRRLLSSPPCASSDGPYFPISISIERAPSIFHQFPPFPIITRFPEQAATTIEEERRRCFGNKIKARERDQDYQFTSPNNTS